MVRPSTLKQDAPAVGFTLFSTPIGPCGIAWSARGIAAIQLPMANVAATAQRVQRLYQAAQRQPPPAAVRRVVTALRALLSGKTPDLARIDLDLESVSDFERRVYAAARTIPAGKTCTYGELAARVGKPGAARAVGRAMGRNPYPLIVPCHRVLAAGARPGGFSSYGGVATKLRLLAIEGAMVPKAGA